MFGINIAYCSHIAGGHMKQFLLILTFSLAFTVAIFARAAAPTIHMVAAPISDLKYSSTSMIVKISGYMPNLCAASPRPVLTVTKDTGVLQLSVAAEMAGDVCMAVTMVGGTYELAFDIRSLKYDLADLHVDVNGIYRFLGPNGLQVAEVDFSQFSFEFPFATQKVAGGVFTVMNDGKLIVIVDKNTAFEVRSPFINLKKYIGHQIDVSGLVLENQKPSIGGGAIERPLFLLTGLNTTAH